MTDNKRMRQVEDDLLIPESVVLRVANRYLGTELKTVDEVSAYLDAHPEERKRFNHRPRTKPDKAEE